LLQPNFFHLSIIHLSLTFGSKAGFDWKKPPLSHQGRWGQCLERDCLVTPDVSKKGQALWAKLLSTYHPISTSMLPDQKENKDEDPS